MSRGSRLALALCLVAVCWLSMTAPPAYAVPPISGAADARMLFGLSNRYGGALSTDLWYGSGVVKAGGVFAVGALSEGGGNSSRVLTPVGLSLALQPPTDASGPTAVARGGVAAGAKKGGFSLGPWASCALGYRFALGEGASIRLGADMWMLFGDGSGLFLAPYVGLGF
jgi:hypothetical protein